MQLAEEGKLSFDDTVGKHLPDYPNNAVADNVTIHQLLTHTSGMGDYFGPQFEQAKANLRAIRDYFPLFATNRLSSAPGSKWRYSNAGYIVLGAIIQRVSGQSYFDYVREHICKLAGMNDTDFYETDHNTQPECYLASSCPRTTWPPLLPARPTRAAPHRFIRVVSVVLPVPRGSGVVITY